jgi:hypothetical protein
MVELTPEQHASLIEQTESPPRVVDPADQQEYVLVPLNYFERLKSLITMAEDETVQQAWLELSRQRAGEWAAQNPF